MFARGPELGHAIAVSCESKAAVVARDETEQGDRALLNLGHTFGHALEKLVAYDSARLVHGEGVAIGMACAFRYSVRAGLCPAEDAERVEAHLRAVGLPTRIRDIAGWSASADDIVDGHGAGQEGEARRADLHPRARHRRQFHRQECRAGGRARLPRRRIARGSLIEMHGGGGVTSMNIWVAAAILFFCILASALFSASETAMTAASRARMHALEKQGGARAAMVNRLLGGRDRLIGTMLLGNTLFNIGSSALLTTVLVAMVGESGALYATIAMTVLLLVFAEVLPKTIAINYPDRISLIVAPIVSVFVTIFGPILYMVEAVVRGALYLCGLRLDDKHALLSPQEELKSAVDLMHKEGGVARADRDMFGGLLDLKELAVSDVMVHRTKMVALDADAPIADLVREVVASPYTRVPLWRGTPDNIIGVLHAKDLLRAMSDANGDGSQVRLEADHSRPLVRAGHDHAGSAIAGLPQAQDPFRAGGRRIWRRPGPRDAGRYSGGNRRRHSRRARRRRASACDARPTVRSLSRARRRSATSTASWPGTFPTKRPPPSPASSFTKRAPSPSKARNSPSTASASRCCASSATASPCCA